MKVGTAPIGKEGPVYMVAELSANHSQSYDIAVETIHAARKADQGRS